MVPDYETQEEELPIEPSAIAIFFVVVPALGIVGAVVYIVYSELAKSAVPLIEGAMNI